MLHPLLGRGIPFALRHDGGGDGGGDEPAEDRRGRRGEKDATEDFMGRRQFGWHPRLWEGRGEYEIKFKQDVSRCAYSATFGHGKSA